MAEPRRSDYTKLPPGWDCIYDQLSGKYYYTNYLTKAMQLEDPRFRYKQLENERCSTESIPMQPVHGSPYHVYPASNFPAVKAFQGPSPSLSSVSASPLLSTKSQQMEMPSVSRQGFISKVAGAQAKQQLMQETSFSSQSETDAVVSKINNMFPTASENHIRLLLKKYYNREAVVISALQVEKHPVTMPGPFATPPSQRHLFHSNSAFQMTPPAKRFNAISRTESPIPGRFGSITGGMYGSPRIGEVFRSSPKPHSSPKMKLRYMKNIFPKADETLLLDILANSDNNVQKASEKLIEMGYTKREVSVPKLSNKQQMKDRKQAEATEAAKVIPLQPKVFTAEEKDEIKARVQARYKEISERVILMALESVDYSEDRASQILHIVQQEDETKAKSKIEGKEQEPVKVQAKASTSSELDRTPLKENKEDVIKENKTDFQSLVSRAEAKGHNPGLRKGPNDEILLADYVTWNGANPDIAQGRKGLASGSDPNQLLSDHSYVAQGHNNDLCKGTKAGLAKGSIYSQLNHHHTTNVKCN